jgi:predicted nucleic acid-binding protein
LTFIDSNVPMYLVGAPHPHKTTAAVLLERLVLSGERLATDAEVLHEIAHRYIAIGRRNEIAPAIQTMLKIADEIFPLEKSEVLRASEIVLHQAEFSARSAIHIAVMERYGIRSLLSFDPTFDRWPGINRIATP